MLRRCTVCILIYQKVGLNQNVIMGQVGSTASQKGSHEWTPFSMHVGVIDKSTWGDTLWEDPQCGRPTMREAYNAGGLQCRRPTTGILHLGRMLQVLQHLVV